MFYSFIFFIIIISLRYKSASKFSVKSQAELLETDLVVARDDKLVNVSTTFQVLEPVLEMTPGQGVTCGSLNCHKYASCEVQFGLEQLPNCICPDGFSGKKQLITVAEYQLMILQVMV